MNIDNMLEAQKKYNYFTTICEYVSGARLFTAKANIACKDMPLHCASHTLHGLNSNHSATLVSTAKKNGYQLAAIKNMDEFVMGFFGRKSIYSM